MDFKNAKELLTLCEEQNLPISEIMRRREIQVGERDAEDTVQKMSRVLEIMKEAAFFPVDNPIKSMGGLIGGESQKISEHFENGKGLCGDLLEKAMIATD